MLAVSRVFTAGFIIGNFLSLHYSSLLTSLFLPLVSFGRPRHLVSDKVLSRNEVRSTGLTKEKDACFLAVTRVALRHGLSGAFNWARAEQFTLLHLRRAALSNGILEISLTFLASLIGDKYYSFHANCSLYF
ncbi:hypothetical protein ISCGN_000607 [Ixodes scapularis]